MIKFLKTGYCKRCEWMELEILESPYPETDKNGYEVRNQSVGCVHAAACERIFWLKNNSINRGGDADD